MLADKLVELQVVDSVSDETVRRTLKKTRSSRGRRSSGASRREANAEFVAAMEDVLEVYHRPEDENRPLVCLDEASRQLIGETVTPIPAEPGQPERFDYEYVRNGVANLFMIFMPLAVGLPERVGDRAAHGSGLRRGAPVAGGGRLPRGREDGAGDGQPEHAQGGLACTRRSRRSRPGG